MEYTKSVALDVACSFFSCTKPETFLVVFVLNTLNVFPTFLTSRAMDSPSTAGLLLDGVFFAGGLLLLMKIPAIIRRITNPIFAIAEPDTLRLSSTGFSITLLYNTFR